MATHLHRLSGITSNNSADFQDEGMYNPVGEPAYMGGQRAGQVADALVDDEVGRLRYLLVDPDGGDLNGAYIVPIGLARIENDGVYFDGLSTSQLSSMHRYSDDEEYTFDMQQDNDRMYRSAAGMSDYSTTGTSTTTDTTMTAGTAAMGTAAAMGAGTVGSMSTETSASRYDYRDSDASDRMFKTPGRLQLLEERLMVNKERFLAGSVQVGKRVVTHQEQVEVPLQREEVIIERHPVAGAQPVQGELNLGAGSETVRVELEAERANVQKQAYVAEEVEIGKRVVTETQQVTETVGREVLDVNQSGDVQIVNDDDTRRNNQS